MAELTKVDFSTGIKAEKINQNFNIVDTWIKNERKRLGGYGLVEGFDLSADTVLFTVTVGKGIFINQAGEEKEIDEKTFYCDAPTYVEVTEKIVCPDTGILQLSSDPYSPSECHYIKYIPPEFNTYPNTLELYAYNEEDEMRVQIIQVSKTDIYINPTIWVGKTICVRYKKAGNRVDSIILQSDGRYRYERSVDSVSPSHVQIKDYGNDFLIGAAYWQISDEGIKVSFYTNHRTYRVVYVDNQNQLWLNGELYKNHKFVYFEEPEVPELNDLWYDMETNNLYVYRLNNGVLGWMAVNDHSSMTVRDHYMFSPDDDNYPSDSQTFKFPEDRLDLHFVPNQNALEIIIDNSPLMSDQYDEIVNENEGQAYLSQGRGFKLKDPLDRATYVQVIVNHQTKSNPLKETFQRASIFVYENFITLTENNTNMIFETDEYYTAGEDQLEVYVNGIRLDSQKDFVQMKNETEDCTAEELIAKKTETKYFRISDASKATIGDRISYKISKYVWNYDQLSLLMGTTLSDIETLTKKVDTNATDINTLNDKIVTISKELDDKITQIKEAMPNMEDYIKKTDTIDYDNLAATIKHKLIDSQKTYSMSTTLLKILDNLTIDDFVQIFYISPDESRILINGTDYNLVPSSGGLTIELTPSLVNRSATLYINAIKLGE